MILFFKKKQIEDEDRITLVCSLLVHAAKIDENYTKKEKKIILSALTQLYNKNEDELIKVLEQAEKLENQSNQILKFTKAVKDYDKKFRLKVLETIWKIIYSDGVSDIYESNLMRRLSSLLYVSDRENGEIKKKLLVNLNL